MSQPPNLIDLPALARNRARALSAQDPALFLHAHVGDILQERLEEVNKTFQSRVLITPFPGADATGLASESRIAPAEDLELPAETHDLAMNVLSLHWANDPVGQLVQMRRTLKPDGLLLCACFGGQTLSELRASLAEAESRLSGGLSPRVAPMGEIRDYGGLLQRAGFALPVADSLKLTVEYQSMFHLMRDLRAMGETNALSQRPRHFTRRALFEEAARIYAENFTLPSGRISATFEIVFLTGWAPDKSQPKPLRPGSATTRLADALQIPSVTANNPKDGI